MAKARALAKVVPLDIRERQVLACIKGALAKAQTFGRVSAEARADAFRQELMRMAGELSTIMRENASLRKANEAYARRIQQLEQNETPEG